MCLSWQSLALPALALDFDISFEKYLGMVAHTFNPSAEKKRNADPWRSLASQPRLLDLL